MVDTKIDFDRMYDAGTPYIEAPQIVVDAVAQAMQFTFDATSSGTETSTNGSPPDVRPQF